MRKFSWEKFMDYAAKRDYKEEIKRLKKEKKEAKRQERKERKNK